MALAAAQCKQPLLAALMLSGPNSEQWTPGVGAGLGAPQDPGALIKCFPSTPPLPTWNRSSILPTDTCATANCSVFFQQGTDLALSLSSEILFPPMKKVSWPPAESGYVLSSSWMSSLHIFLGTCFTVKRMTFFLQCYIGCLGKRNPNEAARETWVWKWPGQVLMEPESGLRLCPLVQKASSEKRSSGSHYTHSVSPTAAWSFPETMMLPRCSLDSKLQRVYIKFQMKNRERQHTVPTTIM